jgi:hypothetical protein
MRSSFCLHRLCRPRISSGASFGLGWIGGWAPLLRHRRPWRRPLLEKVEGGVGIWCVKVEGVSQSKSGLLRMIVGEEASEFEVVGGDVS